LVLASTRQLEGEVPGIGLDSDGLETRRELLILEKAQDLACLAKTRPDIEIQEDLSRGHRQDLFIHFPLSRSNHAGC
jgi:hypothetical protein